MGVDIDLQVNPMMVGISREMVKQILLRGIQDYFSQPGSFLVYDPDPDKTQVHITDEHLSVKETNTMPVIMVLFAGGRIRPIFHNNFVGMRYIEDEEIGTGDPQVTRTPAGNPVASKVYTDMIMGNIEIKCRDRGWQAVRLAETVESLLTAYVEIFRYLGFQDVHDINLGRENRITEDVTTTMTEVSVHFTFELQRRWAIVDTDFECLKRNVIAYIEDLPSAACFNWDARYEQ